MGFVLADTQSWPSAPGQPPFEIVPLQTFENLRNAVNNGSADFFLWEREHPFVAIPPETCLVLRDYPCTARLTMRFTRLSFDALLQQQIHQEHWRYLHALVVMENRRQG